MAWHGAGKLRAIQAKAHALPLPIKLANLQKDLQHERSTLGSEDIAAQIAATVDGLAAAQAAYSAAKDAAAAARSQRDRLTAAAQSVTRLRVAQELQADLAQQVW